jgi:cysteine desulfurase family protein (TIGR01976 family)
VFDVARLRGRFPALARKVGGRAAIYFDGPAGSQVPEEVADAVRNYLLRENANTHGTFLTSHLSDARLGEAHRAAADLFGSIDPDQVVFGQNMTSLTFALSRAIGRTLAPGDEVVVTNLDHDANVVPWIRAAEEAGATVKHLAIKREDCTYDLDHLEQVLSPRTKLVAIAAASNAVGTVHPVRKIADRVHARAALLFVDAVHYAPHLLMDVAAWDADFVACSAYKFFGPHVGLLWGKRELMESLPAYRVRPAGDALPGRWMTGTQSHEGIAGTLAAIEYIASIGRDIDPSCASRRDALALAFGAIAEHERTLSAHMLDGLERRGLTVWGVRDRDRLEQRVPTFGVTHPRLKPHWLAQHMASRGIFVWDGNFYAVALTEALGLEPDGLLRIGLLHYSTTEEIDRLFAELDELTTPITTKVS